MTLINKLKNNVKNSLVTAGIAAMLASCTMSEDTIGLNKVLKTEINETDSIINGDIDVTKYRCTIGAHRGNSVDYTENTLEAIMSASKIDKYAFIEFDIQYTKDDSVVVFHDNSLFRLYRNLGKISNLDYSEITELTNGGVAKYDEVMKVIGDKKVNIEIKSHGDLVKDKKLVDFVMGDLKERNIESDVLLSSISKDIVKYVNGTYSDMKTGQIFWVKSSTYLPFDFLTEKLYGNLSESGADYVMLHVSNLNNLGDLMKFKPKDKTVVFWNFEDKMYIVHKSFRDGLWGDSRAKNLFKDVTYDFNRFFE